jgi:hypothetical protein
MTTPYLIQGESVTVPTGIIIAWPMESSNPGTGWLECNGGTFDQNTYAILYNLLGSNTLPDLRDKVPRYDTENKTANMSNEVTIPVNDVLTHSHGATDVTHSHSTITGLDDANFTGGTKPGICFSVDRNVNVNYSIHMDYIHGYEPGGTSTNWSDMYFEPPHNETGYDKYANGESNITVSDSTGASADQTLDCSITGSAYVRYFIKAD